MEILNTLFTGPAAALTSSTQQAINSPPKDLTRSPQNNMTRSREPRVVGNQSPPLQFPQEQDCEAGQNKRLPGREMMGDASWDCANDVTNASMEEPPKYILNGRLHGRAKAPWRTPAPSHSPPVKTIDPPNMVAVGLLLHHGKKKENGTRVHFVSGLTPGAAAQSGRIAVNDQLLAVNGKDCSKLDGKQVHDLVVGLEGSSITMEFLRERPEAAAPRHESYHHLHQNSDDNKNERFEVVLIRGGVGCFAYTKKLEDAVRWREENALHLNRAFLEEQDQMREMMSVDNVRSLLHAKEEGKSEQDAPRMHDSSKEIRKELEPEQTEAQTAWEETCKKAEAERNTAPFVISSHISSTAPQMRALEMQVADAVAASKLSTEALTQLRDTQAEWEGRCKKAEAERNAALSLVSEASEMQRYLETEIADAVAASKLSKEALRQLRDTQAEWEGRCKKAEAERNAALSLVSEASQIQGYLNEVQRQMVSQTDKIKNLEAERDAALHGHKKDLQMLSQLQDHNSQLQDHNSKTKTAAFAAEQRAEAVLEVVQAQSDDFAQKLRDMQLERDNTFGQSQQYLGQQQEMRHQIEDLKDQLKVALDGKAKAELGTEIKQQELDQLLGRLQARLRDLEDLEYVKGELAGLRDRLTESDKNRQYEADEKDRQAKEAELLRDEDKKHIADLKDAMSKAEAEGLREQLALKDSAAKEALVLQRNALLEQQVAETSKLTRQMTSKLEKLVASKAAEATQMTSKLEQLEARNALLNEQLEARNTLQDTVVKEAETLSTVLEQLALQDSAVQEAEALKDKTTKEAETLREQLALKDSAAKELAERNALLEQKVAEAGKLLKQMTSKLEKLVASNELLEKLVASNESNELLEQHAVEAIKVVYKASADAAFNAPLKALVLTSATFVDTSFPALPQVASAGGMLGSVLSSSGYPASNIVACASNASQADMLQAVAKMADMCPASSTLLIYIGSHVHFDALTKQSFLVANDTSRTQISTTAIPLKTLALEIARIPANRKVILLDIMRHQPEVTSDLTPEKRDPTPEKLVTDLRDQLPAAPSSADTTATNYERKLAGLSGDNWTQGKERDAFLAQVPAFSPLLAHSFSELAQLPSASSARSSTSDRRPGSGTDTRGEDPQQLGLSEQALQDFADQLRIHHRLCDVVMCTSCRTDQTAHVDASGESLFVSAVVEAISGKFGGDRFKSEARVQVLSKTSSKEAQVTASALLEYVSLAVTSQQPSQKPLHLNGDLLSRDFVVSFLDSENAKVKHA